MRGDYAAFWTKPYRDFYIPVTYTGWTWIAQTTANQNGDLRPEPFRTLNLLIHATNSVLVFWLLYLLVQAMRPALLGAILFAIHPLQVESVVWIPELRGLLAALFSLMALVLHCHYRQSGSRRTSLALAAAVSFLVAALAKPSATTLPLALVAVDLLLFYTRLPPAWWKWPLLWAGLSVPLMIIAKQVQPDAAVEFIPTAIGRVKVAADALTFYVGKLFVPWPLSPSDGRTPQAVIGWRLLDVLWVVPPTIFFIAWRFRLSVPRTSRCRYHRAERSGTGLGPRSLQGAELLDGGRPLHVFPDGRCRVARGVACGSNTTDTRPPVGGGHRHRGVGDSECSIPGSVAG